MPDVERLACFLRCVVIRGQGAHGDKAGKGDFVEQGLGAAGQHQVGRPAADHLGRLADGLRPGGTGGDHRGVIALALEQQAEVMGRHIWERGWQGKRVDPRYPLGSQSFDPGDGNLPPTGTDPHDRSRAFGLWHQRAKPGIGHCLDPGSHGQVRAAGHPLGVLEADIVGDIKALYFARDLDRVAAGIKLGNVGHARVTCHQAIPGVGNRQAQRGDGPQARDNDSPSCAIHISSR